MKGYNFVESSLLTNCLHLKLFMTELTIIILTYNSSHILKRCLGNLDFIKHRIIIVDNASRDNTVEFVKNNYPQLQLIQIAKNVGYGRGNNVALRQVESEFALVINPDAMISKDSIEKVLEEMKRVEKAAIAGPLILKSDEISSAAVAEEKLRIENDFATTRDMYCEKIGSSYDTRFISGACIFLRMSVFRKLGFFDEKIFLFYEDDEICLRSKRNGYKNLTVTQAIVCHVGKSSCKKTWRETYRRNWHLKGWSKLYWKEICKGKFRAKKSALRLVYVYFVKSIIALIRFDQDMLVSNVGAFFGSLSFLIGLNSFKKDSSPRG